MNTELVIREHVNALDLLYPDRRPIFSLPDLIKFYNENKKIEFNLSPGVPSHSDLKTDAITKIMIRSSLAAIKKIGQVPWNREYVRKTYGARVENIDYIYYPCGSPKRLIVNFSSMGKDRFDRYSRYYDPTQQWDGDTAYIFFKDDDFTYYLGTDICPKTAIYRRIIRQFQTANSLSTDQVYTVGGSMGGYGALYYAIALELSGAIVCAPQINMRAMQAHSLNNWIRHARETGFQWTDIDLMVHRHTKIPYIYIEHGNYAADRIAASDLISALSTCNTLIIHRRASWSEHTRDDVLPKEIIDSTIRYFESSRMMEKTYTPIT